jgi:DNA helicase II / ATP-dependent DNA helicase PcrA
MKEYVLKSGNNITSTLPEDFYKELNPAQLEAVNFGKGPLLIIAGAGSGKTKTLVYRVAKLVNDGIPPKKILLLTFTRKSSQEMLQRASLVLDERCQNVSGGTFHSFGNSILRRFASHLGYDEHFTILDRSDSEDLIQTIRKKYNFHQLDKRFPKKSAIANVIGKSVNTQKTIESVLGSEYPQFLDFSEEITKIRDDYFKSKQIMQVMDYDDLLTNFLKLLKTSEEVRTKLQDSFEYIMVDEYQDTNIIQANIVQNLVGKNSNVTVVGDDSQSIYSFRGANFKNIMSFPDLFPGAHIIRLEENYRSTQPILDLTNAIIAQAREKYSKTLFTRKESDAKPVFVEADSENRQSKFICKKILELREEGILLDRIAVLIRSGWHSNDLEVELKAHNIPFVKHGGFKFIETSHIKDVISIFKIIYNPLDRISWQRILLMIEGVGPKAAVSIIEHLQLNKGQDYELMKFKTKAYFETIKKLNKLIFRNQDKNGDPGKLLDAILDFYKPLFEQKYDDFSKRNPDLDSLGTIVNRYKDLEIFLTEMSLEPPDASQTDSLPTGEAEEKLVLSTIHSAKGLEWNTVFLLSAVDGYLPSFQSLDDMAQIEEERRLLYVALTRAEENLFIIKPNLEQSAYNYYRFQGMQFSKISRFLEENDLLEKYAEKWMLVEEKLKPKPKPILNSNSNSNSSSNANPSATSNLPSYLQRTKRTAANVSSDENTRANPNRRKYYF